MVMVAVEVAEVVAVAEVGVEVVAEVAAGYKTDN